MDTNIRNLLMFAQENCCNEGQASLMQVYNLIKSVNDSNAVDPAPFSIDLYVLTAEISFQVYQLQDVSKDCLRMYFLRSPAANQFLCRAYLCQSQLLAPKSAENSDELEKAVVFLLKAINIAKENPRYHFLVYNSSVLYWQFSRPFLKPHYRQHLAHSLHQVVKALDDIDDKDYEWRAQLMIALIECHMDAGRKNDASHIATAAATFIKHNVPSLYKTVFGLMVRHQLVDSTKLQKDLKTTPELNIFHKICHLKLSIEENEEKDIAGELQKILSFLSDTAPKEPSPANMPPPSREKTGRRSVSPGVDERRKSKGRSPSATSTSTLSVRLSPVSAESEGYRYPMNDVHLTKPFLLLELARLALEQDFPEISQKCADLIMDNAAQIKDPTFFLEVEFLNCELMVKLLKEKQESFRSNVIEIRQQAIKRCDEAVKNAVRVGNPNVIQAGCVTQWNLCLPILQPNLRQRVRRPLTTVAEALQGIHSLLNQLRCQVHMELAKCEEDQEQIQVALQHLQQAMMLDDGGKYKERLQVAFQKLKLRAELYQQPDGAEQQACMIVEQARKADSGTMRMKRSLLVRAGQTLAPDAFLLVLDSESDTRVEGGKGPQTKITKLANKAQQFNKCVQKAEGHLRRLGNENDRERARLWSDLAKTARKQEVWDVCRVASRFALLYDDGRWKNETSATTLEAAGTQTKASDGSEMERGKEKAEEEVPLYDKDLIRLLAEVNFINGEALIHLLRSEGVELGDAPIPPVDKRKHPKGYVPKKPEEDPDWLLYCEWIKKLSEDSVSCFLRAMNLGVELMEAWIVCSASAYIWNYNNHVFRENRHPEVVDCLQTLLDGLKKTGHANETVMLVNVCNNLATGLIQPWIPKADPPSLRYKSAKGPKALGSAKGSGKGAAPAAKKPAAATVSISNEAGPDLRRAVEVCEYAIRVTDGENASDVVPIGNRYPILQTWVKAKQMLLSNIARSYGANNENSTAGQDPMTRALVGIEMLSSQSNRIFEFKDSPSLAQAVEMVEAAKWTDQLIELQLWTKLAFLALQSGSHSVVVHCAEKALHYASSGTQPKGKKPDEHKYTVEQEMLSYSSCIYGQSLMDSSKGKNSVRRQAMVQFISSARFAKNANNYDLVMSAARHYWNASLALINQPIERELLRDSLHVLLKCISQTTDKKKYRKEEDEDEEEGEEEEVAPPAPRKESIAPVDVDAAATAEAEIREAEKQPNNSIIGGPEDDLTVRAYLYGVLFQSYADKGEWEAGLLAMDEAIADMPRTNHRLLIFKHLVVVKAKLGLNVGMSIQKFKDESEDYVAHMWRRVALCSKGLSNQLIAYQNAIEALNSPSTEWQKVDYLVEFSQWLYCNEFPLGDALDQLQWAIDIILNMKFEVEEAKKEVKPKKGKKKGKTPPASAKKKKDAPSKEPSPRKSPAPSESGHTVASESIDTEMASKEVVIGVKCNNPSLTISDLNNIRQLEMLFRTHVLLAQMLGQHSPHYSDTCLTAFSYIMRIWQVSLSHSGPVMKDMVKTQSDDDSRKSADNKKGKGKEKEVPVKEKPKRKGPLDAIPVSYEDWAAYDVPEEVLEAFKQEAMKTTGINSSTLDKPMLSMFYLDMLIDQLKALKYTHLTLPVLALADVVCRGLLNHRAATALVHLKAEEVCAELNLTNGIAFHSSLAEYRLVEEEQAKAREEIELWKERQAQVAKEEMRLKESLVKFKQNEGTKRALSRQSTRYQMNESNGENETAIHLGKVIAGVEFRHIWTHTAEILIEKSLYKPARELLKESLQAAVAFEEPELHGKVLFLLAKLSFKEAQYGQTIGLCSQAQRIYDGDEMFWYHTTMLIVKATLCDYELKLTERARKARGILVHALNIFKEISVLHPNRHSCCIFILANLEAKLASVQASIAFEEHDNVLKTKVLAAIDSACTKMEHCWNEFLANGFPSEAAQVLKDHALILARLARVSTDQSQKHEYYSKAVELLKRAAAVTEHIFSKVHSTNAVSDLKGLSTPVQREAAVMKLTQVDLMLEIFDVHVDETRRKKIKEMRKGSVLRAVEDLIKDEPDYTSDQLMWMASTDTVGEAILNELSCTHSLLEGLPHLRAKSLLGVGHSLRLQASMAAPDGPGQWAVEKIEAIQVEQHAEEQSRMNATSPKGEEETDDKQKTKFSVQLKTLQKELQLSHGYLTQATECLTQAVHLGLAHNNMEAVANSSLELVECLGQFDPALSAQYLALHQSCQASLYLQDIIERSLCDPLVSQRAALFHQRHDLLNSSIISNAQFSSTMKKISTTLEDSVAWKRLNVSPQHLELYKEFPTNFNLVVMQHSPDKSKLYGAVLEKSKGQTTKTTKSQSLPGSTKAKVMRTETSAEQLEELLSKWKWWRYEVMQILLKQEYQHCLADQKEKMLANLSGGSVKGLSTNNIEAEEVNADEQRLHDEFLQLLQMMEDYLRPLTSQLDVSLRPQSTNSASDVNPPAKGKQAPKDEGPPQEYVVILADPQLMELPLEALSCFQGETIVSLSRDVSLQMLYHRFFVEPIDEAAEKAKKEKEKTKPPPRLPGLRDAAKKQNKIIPLDRPVQPGFLPIDTHSFRFICDPHLDCSETEKFKPIEVLNQVIEEHSLQFTPRWIGVGGDEHTPSSGEYELYLVEGQAFIFYGMERLLCYLPPHKVASMDLPECQFVMMLDLAQTSQSSLRQSKIDVLKTHNVLALERPVEAAMLLSLTGVNCIFQNQWHCSLKENAERLKVSMKDFLEGGLSSGQTARLMFTPYRRKKPETEEAAQETTTNKEETANAEEPAAEEEEKQPVEEIVRVARAYFNMVCYGLPNMVVTQLTKA